MLYFSIGCILLAAIFIFNYKKGFRFPFFTLLVLLLGLLLTVTYTVSDYFTNKGIDESVIYHLRYGLGEAGFAEYAGVIVGAAIALTVIAGFFYYFLRVVLRRSGKGSEQGKLTYTPLLLSILAVGVNPATENIYSLLQTSIIQQPVNHADYVAVSEISDKPLLNLIYIYAESLEETYFDESLFPGLMPNLHKVRDKAIVFKDVAQVTHTGWTIAGMVASQCGVPLFSASQGNAMSGMPKFLSGATCLGDVLNRNKYNLSYLGGASLQFAGKGHFYETHGFSSIQGRDELSKQLADENYQSAWGLYDDSLFDIAKRKLATERAHNNPFALFMLTLDTHHPNGHLSASCAQQSYADGDNPILNAVHCSDRLIGDFIEYIQANGLGDNTLIVIGSDHLAMRNTATHLLEQGDRKNMLIMLPPDLPEGRQVYTPSSILDISATILPMLGFESEKLGLGRNILNTDTPKLIEQHPDFNVYLSSTSGLVASFWDYPEALATAVFQGKKNQAYFGKQKVQYPALFLMDDGYATDKLIFEFHSEKRLSAYLQEQQKGTKLVWIDQCHKVAAVFAPEHNAGDAENCVAMGSLGSAHVAVASIHKNTTIKKSTMRTKLQSSTEAVTQENYQQQINTLRRIMRHGVDIQEYRVLPKGSLYHSVAITSAVGIEQGGSFVKYSHATAASKQRVTGLSRGLNLIGFSDGKPVELIHHLDTCSQVAGYEDDSTLVDILNGHAYEFYLLVAHDSAVCGSTERLTEFMADSSLKLWPELEWRQAYAAIIYQDGSSLELLGEESKPVNVILR